MTEFERVCTACGHAHVGTRAALARLGTCERCGASLPQGMRVHVAGAAAGPDAPAGPRRATDAATDAAAAPACVLVCPRCGNRHEGTAEELTQLWYCASCGESLRGVEPEPAASVAGSTGSAAAPESVAATPAGALVLRLADADVREELPVPEGTGEGVFGRLTATSPALAALRTLSRRQFAYRPHGDGTVGIRNLSGFGTTVAGRRLTAEDDVAVVTPPAVVEMAGLVFSLEREGS